MSLSDGVLHSNIWPYCKPQGLLRENEGSVLRGWRFLGVLAVGMMVGCATPHAILQFTAPPNVTAGTPFSVTVTVLYQGKPDTVINSHIIFTSSDPSAILPGDYTFTPSDAGSHTWTSGFILMTPGSQTISGSIWGSTGINGTAKITVSP